MGMQMRKPAGVGKIARAHQVDPLDCSPGRQAKNVAALAGRPGKMRMNVKIGDILHAASPHP